MSAKQGFGNNRISAFSLCLYGILTGVCLVLGYIESLFPLVVIAPGVKVGLSNCVALTLAATGDKKGAFLVNTARIFLSALLFGSAVSLIFSLVAGTVSLLLIVILSRFKFFSIIGISIIGGVIHNLLQCVVAAFISGGAVFYYLPVLIVCGAVAGGITGSISLLFLKKIKTNAKK